MSRYELFRKRIAPIAFFLAIAFLARESCEKDKRLHTTVELVFGDTKPAIRTVDVDIMAGTEVVATFHRAAQTGSVIGPCQFPVVLPDEVGELRIDIDRGDAHQKLVRRIQIIEGSTTRVIIPDPEPPRQ